MREKLSVVSAAGQCFFCFTMTQYTHTHTHTHSRHKHAQTFFFAASLKSLVYTQLLSVALSLSVHAVEICGYEMVMFLFITWLHLGLQTAHKAMS